MTQKAAARLLKISRSTLSDLLHRAIIRDGHRIRPPLYTILTGLVFFGFHIAKALNESIDEVRKEEWRKASGDERKALKGLRWLLFKHSSRRSKKDTRIHILWGKKSAEAMKFSRNFHFFLDKRDCFVSKCHKVVKSGTNIWKIL